MNLLHCIDYNWGDYTDPTADTSDWLEWPKRYRRSSALSGECVVKDCVGIARVEIVDERNSTGGCQ